MIVTNRLVLRRLGVDDVEVLSSLMDTHTNSMMNIDNGDWTNPRAYRQQVNFARKSRYSFVIEKGQKPIGEISIVRANGGWNLGFWISKKFRGKGYVSEAARAAVKKFDREVGMRLSAGCFKENVASKHILEKLGFSISNTDYIWSPHLSEYKDTYWFVR